MAKSIEQKEHYVDNVKFLQEIIVYKENKSKNIYNEENENYIGNCFLKISTGLSMRDNFRNYPFRQEMVSEAALQCLTYFDNFTPDKTTNPFSYFTQIVFFTFLRYIAKEKQYLYTKLKLIQSKDNLMEFSSHQDGDNKNYDINNTFIDMYKENMEKFIYDFETAKKKKEVKKIKSVIGLKKFTKKDVGNE